MNFFQLLTSILFCFSFTHTQEHITIKIWCCAYIHKANRDSEEPLRSGGVERSDSNLITVPEEKMSCHYVDKYMLVSGRLKNVWTQFVIFFWKMKQIHQEFQKNGPQSWVQRGVRRWGLILWDFRKLICAWCDGLACGEWRKAKYASKWGSG